MVPTIEAVAPSAGSAAGGELVRVTAEGLSSAIDVRFGALRAELVAVRADGPRFLLDVRTPASPPGPTTLTLTNLGPGGVPVAGETASAPFRFERVPIGRESDLTRAVRAVVRALRDQILANTSTPVSLDYRETTSTVIPVARVPSLTLLGPDVRENRLYASNEPVERAVRRPDGSIEIDVLRPPTAVDLRFVVEVVTNSTAEHLELLAALTSFFHRNPYLYVARDGAVPDADFVRFVLAADGDARGAAPPSDAAGRTDDRRAFQWGLVIRGFPVDPYITVDRAVPAASGATVRVGPGRAS
jgi:hypothetical protein